MYYNSTTRLPPGLAYGPTSNCTLSTCEVKWSVYGYRPSLAASALFIAFFALALCFHVYQGRRYRTWFFIVAVVSAGTSEIIGYGGRVMLSKNPLSFDGFLLNISM